MKRRFLSSAAMFLVGALVTAFGLAATASTAASGSGAAAASQTVLPAGGSYYGVDHAGRTITFSFGGNQMSHFAINHQVFGSAHVSSGAWHETCHNGLCTKGRWVSDHHVKGSWRHGGGEWVHFDARTAPPAKPYPGPYMGDDHGDRDVHLNFRDGQVRDLKLDGTNYGDAHVNHGKFDFCRHDRCFKGHWETDTMVVGSWRYSNSHDWHGWEAWAYAF